MISVKNALAVAVLTITGNKKHNQWPDNKLTIYHRYITLYLGCYITIVTCPQTSNCVRKIRFKLSLVTRLSLLLC